MNFFDEQTRVKKSVQRHDSAKRTYGMKRDVTGQRQLYPKFQKCGGDNRIQRNDQKQNLYRGSKSLIFLERFRIIKLPPLKCARLQLLAECRKMTF